jgi:glycine cleavage system transcriptional repressor
MLRAGAPPKQAVRAAREEAVTDTLPRIAESRPRPVRGDSACAPGAPDKGRDFDALIIADDGLNDTQMKQHLAVSAIGGDRTGMVHELTRVISECGGNISESRMASLGTEFAMLLLVSGNWHALAKLETELKRLAETSSLSIHLKRTEPRAARTDMLPYSIDVVCLDQTGIVSGLSGFFSSRGIDIAEVSTRSYPAAHTGAPMFSVQMIVNVPSRIHVAHLREEFMEFCDSLNLDAILEPVKS